MFEDTYFLNANEALRVAKEQNRSQNGSFLQACYYEGEKIDSDLPNLIRLPIDNLLPGLAYGTYRLPQKIDFTGLELSDEIKQNIILGFNETVKNAKLYRDDENKRDLQRFQSARPDFNEPLRFYLMASANTNVLQYVSKNIAKTLEKMGYEVVFKLYYGIEDMGYFKDMADFNPHVQININHLHNHYLNESIFNIIWIQDAVAMLFDDKKIPLRKRDFIFTLVKDFEDLLKKKGIESLRQSFCVNDDEYKLYPDIKREKKIVFIGSSYSKHVKDDENIRRVIDHLSRAFQNGETFMQDKIDKISKEFNVDKTELTTRIIPFVIRDVSVLMLCNIDSDYEVEIYGYGWEDYDSIKEHYKGELKYGEDIAKVYNGATYAFSPHPEYILQQRVFEASACGAIPIQYDCRDICDEDPYNEAFIYFRTQEDLARILKDPVPKKDFSRLLKENSYEYFVQKILKIVKDNTQNG